LSKLRSCCFPPGFIARIAGPPIYRRLQIHPLDNSQRSECLMVLSNDLKLLSPGFARLSFKPSTSVHGFILLKVFQRLPAFPTSSLFRDSALTLRRIDPSHPEPCQAQLFDKANLPRQVNSRGLLVHPINPRPRYSALGSHLDDVRMRSSLSSSTNFGRRFSVARME
ncbi:hypothetical protein RB213_009186, partial [Colletotrichum asianum]